IDVVQILGASSKKPQLLQPRECAVFFGLSFESPFGGFPFRRSSCSINSPNWVDALLLPVLAVASDLVLLAGCGLPVGRGRAS
nr:hypothetical protein [Tanacetum cinerariifolium]